VPPFIRPPAQPVRGQLCMRPVPYHHACGHGIIHTIIDKRVPSKLSQVSSRSPEPLPGGTTGSPAVEASLMWVSTYCTSLFLGSEAGMARDHQVHTAVGHTTVLLRLTGDDAAESCWLLLSTAAVGFCWLLLTANVDDCCHLICWERLPGTD